jgi:hypothetical protein
MAELIGIGGEPCGGDCHDASGAVPDRKDKGERAAERVPGDVRTF